ncbi:MAG: monovalent cation/H+ antiporter subunit D family protein [Gammaproteobacteria bacterium]|nr:monovalent cation/H+ antiporter subunit D family protein [Gammaproteobacteria bacterium]
MSVEDVRVLVCVLLPLGAVPFILLAAKRPNLREAIAIATGAVLFVLVWSLWDDVAAGERPGWVIANTLPGLPLALEVEPLGLLFAMIASFLWIVTTIYAIGYMRAHHEQNQTRFYACFALAISSAVGVAFSANLFTLFIFYEVLTLSTYPLVTHAGTDEARRAGRTYLGILIGSSIAFQLVAIIWTWSVTGTSDFEPGGILDGHVGEGVASVLLVLYVFGIGKAALMPLHRWLPAAMVAPTPVSALLHAVAVVKAGVFSILKVAIYVFGLDFLATVPAADWLAYLAGLTIVLGSLIAMTQDNLKARLAYSTVSQLSYIILGALLANFWAVIGAAIHILMHAFAKITLFFCAGAIMVVQHKTEVSELTGLGRKMPITMIAFLIASLSVVGLPLLGGMWSKWYLVLGSLEEDKLILLAVLLVSSLLNVAYLSVVPIRALFGRAANDSLAPTHDSDTFRWGLDEAPLGCMIAILVTVFGCAFLFWNVGAVFALLQGALSVP